jgi:hypothetical protein
MNHLTVYKEEACNDWWTYNKNGAKKYISRSQGLDILQKPNSKFVVVKTAPWQKS